MFGKWIEVTRRHGRTDECKCEMGRRTYKAYNQKGETQYVYRHRLGEMPFLEKT